MCWVLLRCRERSGHKADPALWGSRLGEGLACPPGLASCLPLPPPPVCTGPGTEKALGNGILSGPARRRPGTRREGGQRAVRVAGGGSAPLERWAEASPHPAIHLGPRQGPARRRQEGMEASRPRLLEEVWPPCPQLLSVLEPNALEKLISPGGKVTEKSQRLSLEQGQHLLVSVITPASPQPASQHLPHLPGGMTDSPAASRGGAFPGGGAAGCLPHGRCRHPTFSDSLWAPWDGAAAFGPAFSLPCDRSAGCGKERMQYFHVPNEMQAACGTNFLDVENGKETGFLSPAIIRQR